MTTAVKDGNNQADVGKAVCINLMPLVRRNEAEKKDRQTAVGRVSNVQMRRYLTAILKL